MLLLGMQGSDDGVAFEPVGTVSRSRKLGG